MAQNNQSPAHSSIDESTFNHLVKLAALDLTEQEGRYLREQLNQQMRAIAELESIEIDPAAPITSHGVPYTSENSAALREDEHQQSPEADDILGQAPEVYERYLVVPDIPHEDLA